MVITKESKMGFRRVLVLLSILCLPSPSVAQDIKQIKQKGVLRHLGVEYANFVRIRDNELCGMSVELIRLFA